MKDQAAFSHVLPYVTLRPDYAELYRDVADRVTGSDSPWLSLYCSNAPQASIHAKLSITESIHDNGRADVTIDDAFAQLMSVQQIEGSELDLRVATTSQQGGLLANRVYAGISLPPTVLRLPRRTKGPLVKGSAGITAFDVAQTSDGHYVVGGEDGQAHIGRLQGGSLSSPDFNDRPDEDVETRAQRRMQQRSAEQAAKSKISLKGHVGDVRSARFFPSGQVVLTTSSDCTAKIFGLDGSNPRTLKGHRRAVVCSAFIDRGKDVVTGSLDGTARLWDVGSDKQLRSFDSQAFSSVNTIALDSNGKLLFTGLGNGILECWDLATGKRIHQINRISFPMGEAPAASDRWTQELCGSITALDVYSERNHVLSGTTNGILTLYDYRMLRSTSASTEADATDASVLANWKRNSATINDVRFVRDDKYSQAIVASADGTPYRVGVEGDTAHVVEEFCGWDVDNVEAIAFDLNNRVWLAGAQGVVTQY